MRIASVQADHYNIPLPEVCHDSVHGEMSQFGFVTVRLRTEDGAEGTGYTYTVRTTGAAGIHSLIESDLAGLITGADPRRIEQLWQRMWWHLHYVGRGGAASFAMAAVDIALWDLKARLAGEPLWRFLGGCSPRVKVYAGGIDLNLPIDRLRQQTRRNLDRGFRAIKMKVGREDLGEDVARVGELRRELGPNIPLMVDANMRWSVEQAIRAARALADHDVYWLEEPTIPDDVEGHAAIARQSPIPIATGENLRTLYDFQKLLASGGVAFPEPDVSNIGGITAWLKVAHLAEAHNLPVTTHGVHDLHVHLLAAVPNASYLEAHGFGLEAFIENPLEVVEGEVTAPEGPGHGVELLWDKLEAHRAAG
ncbi:MAG: mandelate racemase/muconate lactonizing enzyme family protein [bacterium]|nr:mandelate racemase/muconate lactonizing enzyme family protein [bacterium]